MRREYENQLVKDFKSPSSIRKFFKHVNQHRNPITSTISLLNDLGNLTATDSDTANTFIKHFETVYNNPVARGSYLNTLPRVLASVDDVEITEQILFQKLELLDISKSPGLDNIHPKILKMFSHHFSILLSILFSKSILTGVLPSDWKNAYIIPIHKKDSKQHAKNFRPISITSSIIKLFESIIKPHIVDHLIKNDIIHPDQHGFIPGRSTISNLLEVLENWTLSLDNILDVVIVYIDFEKAFDKVQHNILLDKLDAVGIRGNLLNWLECFLTNRTQSVKLRQSLSNSSSLTSGIPQGSVLGPILFLIYTFDIPSKSIYSNPPLDNRVYISSFADDTKYYTTANLHNRLKLESTLLSLLNWSQRNHMSINMDKCNILHLGKKHHQNYPYSIDKIPLHQTSLTKDMG